MNMVLRFLNKIFCPHRRLAWLLACVAALAFGCEQKARVITAAQVENFLKAVDAAAAKKDPQVLLDHMAPDVLITVKMDGPNGPQIVRLNGKDYRIQVKDQLAALKDYKCDRSDTWIQLSKDKQQARVRMKVSELLTTSNGTYRAETKQHSLFVLKDGKLWIQSVEFETTASRVK